MVFYRLLLCFGLQQALASEAALVLGAGTILFFYARIPYAVVPGAVLLMLALYLVVLVEKHPNTSAGVQFGRLIASGLALGTAVAIEYIQVIGAALVFLYAWKMVGTRRIWMVMAGGLPLGLLIMVYHYSVFGSPFTFPYKYAVPIIAVDNGQAMLQVDHPTWERLIAVTFGPRRGLFVYSPVLCLLALLMAKDLLRDRIHVAESLLGLSLLAAYLVFQASSPLASVTWGVGPRYAAAMVPFLMLGVILIRKPLELRAFHCLAGLSLLVSLLMVQYDIEPQHHAFPLADAACAIMRSGPSSSFLGLTLPLVGVSSPLGTWTAGVAAFATLAATVWCIWKRTEPQGNARA